jgi:hypothetical protein
LNVRTMTILACKSWCLLGSSPRDKKAKCKSTCSSLVLRRFLFPLVYGKIRQITHSRAFCIREMSVHVTCLVMAGILLFDLFTVLVLLWRLFCDPLKSICDFCDANFQSWVLNSRGSIFYMCIIRILDSQRSNVFKLWCLKFNRDPLHVTLLLFLKNVVSRSAPTTVVWRRGGRLRCAYQALFKYRYSQQLMLSFRSFCGQNFFVRSMPLISVLRSYPILGVLLANR